MPDGSMSGTGGRHVLTRDLLEPFDDAAARDRGSVVDAARRIPRTLADLAVPRPGGGSFRLTDHHVRAALAPPDGATIITPFAWSARTARRALGLAGVRALVAGAARSPIDGVSSAIDDAPKSA